MHQFKCKAQGGNIVPLEHNKEKLLSKLLKYYEDDNKVFKITLEIVEKRISNDQISVYNAFVIKSSEHFGNTFKEMEKLLFHFYPISIDTNEPIPVRLWSKGHLDKFISQATAHLSQFGFKF